MRRPIQSDEKTSSKEKNRQLCTGVSLQCCGILAVLMLAKLWMALNFWMLDMMASINLTNLCMALNFGMLDVNMMDL